MNIEKEKLEIAKLIAENKRIEQENIQKNLDLERQRIELKNKEIEEMKLTLKNNEQNTKSNSIQERSMFNNDPYHFPLIRNIQHNFTFCVWFKTSQLNAGISGIYDKEFGSGGHDRHMGLKNGMP